MTSRQASLLALNGLRRMSTQQLSFSPPSTAGRDGLRKIWKKQISDSKPTATMGSRRMMSTEKKCTPESTGVAINGFGRIGKCLLRSAAQNDINVVAVNQPFIDIQGVINSLKFDTVHGPFDGKVEKIGDRCISVNGKPLRVFHEANPEKIKWHEVGADYVIEATGKFTSVELASKHLISGAKKVIISAPSKDAPMFVCGVNLDQYKKSMNVVSNASCTTNCAAPLVYIMDQRFEVVNCLLTTTHAMTASQHVHDGLNHRSAVGNIVPSSTGAAKAVGRVIPTLQGKVDGDAARVPTLNVSLLKLYINVKKDVTAEAVKEEVKKQAELCRKGLIFFREGKTVSSDFNGSKYSAVVDFSQIKVIDKLVTIGAWYDNEMGYSTRVLDLVKHMIKVDNEVEKI